MGRLSEMPDPECPSCMSVLSVVEAPATYHQWWCQACDLLFSTTASYAQTAPDWAAGAHRRWIERRNKQSTPEPTDTAEALAERARAIAAGPPPKWRTRRRHGIRERNTA